MVARRSKPGRARGIRSDKPKWGDKALSLPRDGAMLPGEVWDTDTAQRYDTPDRGMFAPAVVEPAVDRLAELAGRVPRLSSLSARDEWRYRSRPEG